MDLQGKFKRLIKRKASPIALRGSRHAPDGDVHQPDHDQQLPQSPSSYTPVTDTEAAAQDSRANIEADETLASVEQRASKADGQGKAAGYTQAHQTEHTLADALPHRPRTRSRSRSVDPDSLSAQPVLVVQHPTPEFEHAQHHFGLKDAHGQPDTRSVQPSPRPRHVIKGVSLTLYIVGDQKVATVAASIPIRTASARTPPPLSLHPPYLP